MSKKYVASLENIIKQMLQPLKGLPFNLVIDSLTGYKVIPFNKQDDRNISLLKTLEKVALYAGKMINENGILRKRANEVGNDIENFVKDALIFYGFECDIPKSIKGLRKSSGYPDLEFKDQFNRYHYLECKTFNIDNFSSSFRSFYLSPSKDPKITRDAHHLAISYEIYVEKSGEKNLYKTKSWKLLTLENLALDVKHEFNSNNKNLYHNDNVLSTGKID